MLSRHFIDAHDAVFVLTAAGFDERQRSTTEQLGSGSFEFVFGVNMKDVALEQLRADGVYDEPRAISLNRGNHPMSLGEVCCSMGHNIIYHRMEEQGIERALIFEDDVTVAVEEEERISAAIADVPSDAELVYWDWSGWEYRPWYATVKENLYYLQHRLGLMKMNPTMISNMFPRPYNASFMVAGRNFCTGAYSITLAGARKLLILNEPIALQSDNAIMHACLNGELRCYLSKTRFFSQHAIASLIR